MRKWRFYSIKRKRQGIDREEREEGIEREKDAKDAPKMPKGSYTVEAAILMPVIFFVLAALLAGTFYLHDRAVLQAATCEIVSAGINRVTEKEQKQVISRMKSSLTGRRLMGSRELSGQVDAGKKKVSATWSGRYPVPGLAMKYFSGGNLMIRVSWSSDRIKPADMIRKIRGIRKLAVGGTG